MGVLILAILFVGLCYMLSCHFIAWSVKVEFLERSIYYKVNRWILTICMLGNFSRYFWRLLIFFKIEFCKKCYLQGIKHFGSRSDPTFCLAWSGSKLFARLLADDKIATSKERVNMEFTFQSGKWELHYYLYVVEEQCGSWSAGFIRYLKPTLFSNSQLIQIYSVFKRGYRILK